MSTFINPIEKICNELKGPVEGLKSDMQNRVVIERFVLPIIFIPGIMGSRLGTTQNDIVWDPNSSWFMFTTYGRRKADAAKKRALLIGDHFDEDYLQVLIKSEDIKDKKDGTRGERGWGGVAWKSYGEFLNTLQKRKWDSTVSLFFEFPVHCFGYNWTASNELAVRKLAEYIVDVKKSYKDKGRRCEKVILVTHSMGGLVARAACTLSGAMDNVLGVIHGVQPANGSPAAYWRMKGGFERPHAIPELALSCWWKNPVKAFKHLKGKIVESELLGLPFTNLKIGKGNITAWVLGTDGEEVTALMGNMPGGLQLLPNKQYKNNDGHHRWLELYDINGGRTMLPEADPYEEIYRKKDVYYRLVKPEWLDPGKNENKENNIKNGDGQGTKDTMKSVLNEDVTSWDFYLGYLAEAEKFHDHLNTDESKKIYTSHQFYQFYSSGIASADRIVFERSEDSLWESIKRFFGTIAEDLPGDLKSAAKSLVFTAVGGGAFSVGSKLIDVALDATGGAVVKDTDWYQNRGGYRDRVDGKDVPNETGPLNLVTMQLPDGAGDGTVPESSGMALKLGEDTKRTFCIADKEGFEADFAKENAPRTKPRRGVDFDESWFDRGHEPIFKTKSAQHITFTAIENICRKEIKRMLGET